MDCVDLHLSYRCRQVIQAKAHCHGQVHFTYTVAADGVHPSAVLSHLVALQSLLGQESKGTIRHPRRKFPWAQQHKICEISTHEKNKPDRRAQVYHHLGGETCCVWVFQGSQWIAAPVLAVPGLGALTMSRAMAAHAPCGWGRMPAPLAYTIVPHRAAGCPSLLPHTSPSSLSCACGYFTVWISQMEPLAHVATAHVVFWSSNMLILFFSSHHIFKLVLFGAVTNICLPYQRSVQPDLESRSHKTCRSGTTDWGPYLDI